MAIKHLFVLMLENRSFDHMLGFADLQGIDAQNNEPTHTDDLLQPRSAVDAAVVRGAPWKIYGPVGPAHEFEDVIEQLCGSPIQYQAGHYPPITMSGFVGNYQRNGAPDPSVVMKCFEPTQVPVLTTLAQEFAVCDRWFASMPGPTWPNRFFVHAASSAGLDDSPSALSILQHQTVDGFEFPNGTIFDRLGDDWLVFHGDPFPCVYSFAGMGAHWREGRFQPQSSFAEIVSAPDFTTRYVFIEPHYGRVYGDYEGGTSQHPVDDVTKGEQLIKDVYEAIRKSPHWNESALVITYDEHGGFYDHVPPPTAPAPDDGATGTNYGFDFKQLGVRVPAVIVSPLVPRGMIDHRIYDHSSVPATLTKLFTLPPVNGRSHLTNRDAQANTFEGLFSLPNARTDAPDTLPNPPDSGFRFGDVDDQGVPTGDIDPNTRGFLYVAFLRQYGVSPTIAARSGIAERFLRISTKLQALNYLREVRQHVGEDTV